jgi:hypothetical protein
MWVWTGHGEDAVSTQEERQLSISGRGTEYDTISLVCPRMDVFRRVAAFRRAEKLRKSEGE